MPQPVLGPAGVTVVTPPSHELYTEIIKLSAIAGDATGFLACKLPKNAFVTGVNILSMGANATQTVNVGVTLGGQEFVNAYAPNSTGYAAVGDKAGTYVGTQLTVDTPVYAKASATLTNIVYVYLQYYIPQQGMTW